MRFIWYAVLVMLAIASMVVFGGLYVIALLLILLTVWLVISLIRR